MNFRANCLQSMACVISADKKECSYGKNPQALFRSGEKPSQPKGGRNFL